MRKLIVSLFTLLCLKSFCQTEASPHGTLVFAMICNDGIIICADSRASWQLADSTGKFLEYYAHVDSAKKIFKIGNFYLGLTGRDSFHKMYFENMIKKYNKKHKSDTSIIKTFLSFKNYLNKRFRMSDSALFMSTFYLVGYDNNVPTIMVKSPDTTYLIKQLSFIPSDERAKKYFHPNPPYNCLNEIEPIKKMYENFEGEEVGVGGPLNIIQINPNNTITELSSINFKTYKNENQYFKQILNDKIIVVYHYPWAKKYLHDLLEIHLKMRE